MVEYVKLLQIELLEVSAEDMDGSGAVTREGKETGRGERIPSTCSMLPQLCDYRGNV